jgi:hypothetical protein
MLAGLLRACGGYSGHFNGIIGHKSNVSYLAARLAENFHFVDV